MNVEELAFNNYLLVLKSCTEVYVHGTLESSNQDIREVLKHGLDVILKSQASTYDLMVENNWYEVSNIDSNKIKKIISKLNN